MRKSQFIQNMFNQIAPSYDLGNDLISFGQHLKWKQKLVDLSGAGLNSKVLDCATGTGDVAGLFSAKNCDVTAIDFSQKMITEACMKYKYSKIKFHCMDLTKMDFEKETFDICSISYGIRNVEDPIQAIKEMTRVLKTNGRLLILETGTPSNIVLKAGHSLHTKYLLPKIGAAVSKNKDAYNYLASSSNNFPSGVSFMKLVQQSKLFKFVQAYPLLGGSSYLYLAIKK